MYLVVAFERNLLKFGCNREGIKAQVRTIRHQTLLKVLTQIAYDPFVSSNTHEFSIMSPMNYRFKEYSDDFEARERYSLVSLGRTLPR